MSKKFIFGCIVLSLLLSEGLAKAILKIQLISYSNRAGRNWGGGCCDIFCNKCDHRFKVCLDTHTGSEDVNSCIYFEHDTSEYLNTNYVEFGHDISSLINPFDVEMDKWPGKVYLKIRVLDDDTSHSAHDLVDYLYYKIQVSTPAQSEELAQFSPMELVRGTRVSADKTSLAFRYMVYCEKDYYGDDCSRLCKAKDSITQGHYTCDPDTGDRVCLPGWEDPASSCKQEADNCLEKPCFNGGTCVDEYRSYKCECIPGYSGKNCEKEVNECDSSPCLNGGTCTDRLNKYSCECPPERVGPNCEYHICLAELVCKNGGTCYDAGQCLCSEGFFGDTCQYDKCEVSLNCKNDATCDKGECKCLKGFIGTNCDLNMCDPLFIVCHHGGSCDKGVCLCPVGYTGRFCELNINDCIDRPCLNEGTCLDGVDSFTCRCLPGFQGDTCENQLQATWSPQVNVTRPDWYVDPATADANSGGGPPLWAIILIAVVAALVVAVLLIVFLLLKYRKKSKKAAKAASEGTTNPAFAPQDLDSLAQHRASLAVAGQQLAAQQAQVNAAQQLAAAQLAAARQLQAANPSQHANNNLNRQTNNSVIRQNNNNNALQNGTPSGAAGGAQGTVYPNLFDPIKNNNLMANNDGLDKSNLYENSVSMKSSVPGKLPAIPMDIAAASKAAALEGEN